MKQLQGKTPGRPGKTEKAGLLDDFRVRMVLAVVLAVVCWVVVTMVVQPNTTKQLDNVPVDFTYDGTRYTSLGLSIVNEPSATVTLALEGDGSTLGGLTAEDFVVYPRYSAVRGAGTVELGLEVRCTAETASNVVVSIVPSSTTVEVVFDTVEEKYLSIEVKTPDVSVAEGYTLYRATAVPAEVLLTGPSTELETIDHAVATVSLDGSLDETVTVPATLEFVDADGAPVEFGYVTAEAAMVDVTMTVYKYAELPITVSFVNTPPGFDDSLLKYSLSQQTLEVVGPASVIDSTEELTVGSIDLSTFALDKVYELPISLPNGLESQENVTTVTVSFDTTEMATKTLNLPADCVQVVNLPSTYQLEVLSDRIMNVTLCGPAEVLDGLTASSVVARIDADELSIVTGQQRIAVSIYVPAQNQVFALGNYTVQCQIESN